MIDVNIIAKSLRNWLSPEFYSEADIHKMATEMKKALESAKSEQPVDCREAFEKWAARQLYKVGSHEDGRYVHPDTRIVWECWQAAWQHKQPVDYIAIIEHRQNDYARIVRLMDVSVLPHGTKLYAMGDASNGAIGRIPDADDSSAPTPSPAKPEPEPVKPVLEPHEISEHGGDANYWKTRFLLLEQRTKATEPVSVSLLSGAMAMARTVQGYQVSAEALKVFTLAVAKVWGLKYVD